MSKLSVAIITKDSEKTIKECIDSAKFADEIVVVDSGSSDKTVEICEKNGCKVIKKEWMGFAKQKQFAIDNCKNEWVFVLDSDEIITKELQEEIKKTLLKPECDGYFIARLNYFFGKAIRHCGLYPDRTLRLFDKTKGKFSSDSVHEKVVVEGKTGTLKNHMLHYAYDSIEEFIEKQNRYSSLNKKPNRLKALLNPPWTFFKIYFLKAGFLEGWHGLIIAKLYSQYTFWKYIK
ncbi:MAG: glycosyltransferase family 2 protein [Epsilonproteobacteria bacterium]|nr:glycosyltransferase family 2 protein [Campylobacterota bacterium]